MFVRYWIPLSPCIISFPLNWIIPNNMRLPSSKLGEKNHSVNYLLATSLFLTFCCQDEFYHSLEFSNHGFIPIALLKLQHPDDLHSAKFSYQYSVIIYVSNHLPTESSFLQVSLSESQANPLMTG